jgi:hypothetical protein
MRFNRWPLLLASLASVAIILPLAAQDEPKTPVEVDGSDIQRELQERQRKIEKLSTEEQEKLRLAHVKANDDPEVQKALANRNAAIYEFRLELHRAMLKIDPSLEPVLQKMERTRVQGQGQ